MKIGKLMLPSRLFEMMRAGVQVQVETALSDRVGRIVAMYEGMSSEYFYSCMEKITPYISKKAKDEAITAYSNADMATTARVLLSEYYDKVYKKIAHVDHKIHYADEQATLEKLREIQRMKK